MAQIILNVSDETLNYFKRFKLTNIGDGKYIDAITESIKNSTDYRQRLKADLEAILVKLQLEIEEIDSEQENCDYATSRCIDREKVNDLIQQKIDVLKTEK